MKETVEVWPENVQAVNAFVAMGTQWRCGPGGAYGLDYGVMPQTLRMLGIPRAKWPELFDAIREMEDAALKEMHEED